jgi:peptidoglycan/LPS O-acetylase OafA/YrhL
MRRLAGVDLFRGFAAYAVVLIHAPGVHGNFDQPKLLVEIVNFSQFAVPFFLATSFYLTISKIYATGTPYPLQSKVTRLLIPYGFWSVVYIIYTGLKYLIKGESDNLNSFFKDPISLIFFGGAALPLYFLPLLFSGMLLIKLTEFLIKKRTNLKVLISLCVLSLSAYELILWSGNSFHIVRHLAFQTLLNSIFPEGNENPLLRIVLCVIALFIRCSPYIIIAMLLNNQSLKGSLINLMKPSISYTIVLFGIFFILNLFGGSLLPQSVYEVTRGYSALLFAISISNYIKENNVITNLGISSFGIYLIHYLILVILLPIENRIYPNAVIKFPVSTVLIITTLSFIMSWLVTYLLMRKRSMTKLMFGI